ncbi:MAG: hypothetical protein AAGA01_10160 [Cyanobacteria bacterium P01_E01_bin.43]
MSVIKQLFQRFNKPVLVFAIAIATTISIFMSSAIARPPSPYITAISDWVNVDSGQSVSLFWQCPAGRGAISGGFQTEGVSGNSFAGFKVINSHPENYNTWRLRLNNTDDIARNVKIYTVCALP